MTDARMGVLGMCLKTIVSLRTASRYACALLLVAELTPLIPAQASTPLPLQPSIDLNAYRGKVVYLDFWASWCAPCRMSFQFMNSLKYTLSPKDFAIVTVNVDHDQKRAEQFIQANSPNITVIMDRGGKIASSMHVETMPTSYIIDRTGHIRYTHRGFLAGDADVYRQEINDLIGGGR